MTAEDLKKLGFKKTKVSAKDSGDKPYHYYTYDFKGAGALSLLSSDSDKAKEDGGWKVELFDANLKPFTKKSKLKQYIKLIKSLEK